jgi:hypothetical protein
MNKFQILILIAIGLFLLIYAGNSFMNYSYYDKIDKKLESLDTNLTAINKESKRIGSKLGDIGSDLEGPIHIRGDVDATVSY